MPTTDAGAGSSEERSRADLLYTAIWTVFLAAPLAVIVWVSTAPMPLRILAAVATIAFGVVYVVALRRHGAVDDRLEIAPDRRGWLGLAGWAAVLVAIAALALPALGIAVLSFAPFLASFGMFSLPLRAGLAWTAAIVAAMLGIVMLAGGELLSGELLGPASALVFITAMRVIVGQSLLEERARRERLAVREREEISRDVHDILGHTLTAVSLKSQLARRTLRADPDRAEAELDEVLRLTQLALDDVRATVGRLRIPDLASQLDDVRGALEDAGVEVAVRGEWRSWSPKRRALAAWALREGSTNVLRHAQAGECAIVFGPDRLELVDDGIGADLELQGHGLTGLRRRAEAGGARLELAPAHPGRPRPGTRLAIVFGKTGDDDD